MLETRQTYFSKFKSLVIEQLDLDMFISEEFEVTELDPVINVTSGAEYITPELKSKSGLFSLCCKTSETVQMNEARRVEVDDFPVQVEEMLRHLFSRIVHFLLTRKCLSVLEAIFDDYLILLDLFLYKYSYVFRDLLKKIIKHDLSPMDFKKFRQQMVHNEGETIIFNIIIWLALAFALIRMLQLPEGTEIPMVLSQTEPASKDSKLELHEAYFKSMDYLIFINKAQPDINKLNVWISQFNKLVTKDLGLNGMDVVPCFDDQRKYVDDKIQEIREKLGELSIFQVHIHWIRLIFIFFFSWILGSVNFATMMSDIYFVELKKIFDASPLNELAQKLLDETAVKGTPSDELKTCFAFMEKWSIDFQRTKIEPLKLENEEEMALTLMITVLLGQTFFINFVGNDQLCKVMDDSIDY
ncbi:hypothetical protein Ciccas_009080 [Cichlidogyrus casuarinus]|uniref:Uncharacterized protein n=1 Tax=Cichlidogyrus casuarinus TaxID=1844966 RepID=A0ABD2PY35_9PLAT